MFCRFLVTDFLLRMIFMSDYKEIVPLVFEEMAEEEDLFSSGQTPLPAGVYNPICDHQIKSLEGIIIRRAYGLLCSPATLRLAFTTAYQIEDLCELPRDQFDEAVQFLQEFNGIN